MSISHRRRGGDRDSSVDAVAGNGLLDRRALLGGIVLASAAGTGITASHIASAEPLTAIRASSRVSKAPAPPITSSTAQSLRTDCITSSHLVVRQISIPTSTDW